MGVGGVVLILLVRSLWVGHDVFLGGFALIVGVCMGLVEGIKALCVFVLLFMVYAYVLKSPGP